MNPERSADSVVPRPFEPQNATLLVSFALRGYLIGLQDLSTFVTKPFDLPYALGATLGQYDYLLPLDSGSV